MSYSLGLEVNKWIVKKHDLKKLCGILISRFKSEDFQIEVDVKTRNGTETERLNNFEELDEFLASILASGSEFTRIRLSGFTYLKTDESKFASINIEATNSKVYFRIVSPKDNESKDWADGFYAEVQPLLNSFEATENEVNFLKEKFPDKFKYADNFAYFDYDDTISTEMSPQIKLPDSTTFNNSNIHYGHGDIIRRDKISSGHPTKAINWTKWGVIITAIGVLIAILAWYYQ